MTSPAGRLCSQMVWLSAPVVGPSEELRVWRQLGAAVGQSQYFLKWGAGIDTGDVPGGIKKLPDLARELSARGQGVVREAIEATVRKVQKPLSKRSGLKRWQGIGARYLEVAHLDSHLRARLESREAPELLLALDRDSITFFGERRALNDFPQSEMACLWVLAERAGTPAPREDIVKEGRLQTDEDNLKFIVSRLRKILKDLVRQYCRRTGHETPRGFDRDCFIRGGHQPRRGRGQYTRGPYTLDLNPACVQVTDPRPAWMKPTSSS